MVVGAEWTLTILFERYWNILFAELFLYEWTPAREIWYMSLGSRWSQKMPCENRLGSPLLGDIHGRIHRRYWLEDGVAFALAHLCWARLFEHRNLVAYEEHSQVSSASGLEYTSSTLSCVLRYYDMGLLAEVLKSYKCENEQRQGYKQRKRECPTRSTMRVCSPSSLCCTCAKRWLRKVMDVPPHKVLQQPEIRMQRTIYLHFVLEDETCFPGWCSHLQQIVPLAVV